MTFGERIRAERERQGLRQLDIARRAQVSTQYLNDIERGRRDAPPDETIRRIAEALGAFPDLLYFWAGRLPPHLRDTDADPETILDALAEMAIALHYGST